MSESSMLQVISAAAMDILQDPIGTYRMKGISDGIRILGSRRIEKKIVNGYNTVYLRRFTVTIRCNTAH